MPFYRKTLGFYTSFAFISLAFILGNSCSSKAPRTGTGGTYRASDALPEHPLIMAPDAPVACPKWVQQLNGRLSHVTSSADGQRLLVSTSSEGHDEGRARLFDGAGRVLWTRALSQPAKSQALSEDGTLFAINTYDGKLHVFKATPTRSGKLAVRELWARDHLGKVVIAENANRIYLLNDDDSEPQTAFVSYDYNGKTKVDVALKNRAEPIDMFVSEDERYVVVTLADRTLIAFDFLGKVLWQTKLDGDAVSVASGALGKTAQTYALVSQPRGRGKEPRKQLVALTATIETDLSPDNRVTRLWNVDVGAPFDTLQLLGESVVLYGNSHHGQAVAGLSRADGNALWRYTYPDPANYSSPVACDRQPEAHVTVAVDDGMQAGVMRIIRINETGKLLWSANVEAASGIYSFTTSSNEAAVTVGAGEPGKGKLYYYLPKRSAGKCGAAERRP